MQYSCKSTNKRYKIKVNLIERLEYLVDIISSLFLVFVEIYFMGFSL